MRSGRQPDAPPAADRLLEIDGIVQGVGFRPFVARLAARLGVDGWVRNTSRGVQVRVAGPDAVLDGFVARLRDEAPPAARLSDVRPMRLEGAEAPPLPKAGFLILDSDAPDEIRRVAATPDLALCPDCRREMGMPGDRRREYPFINCTNCGPRYSIIEALPYDRARTTMATFRMCQACAVEYASPASRRFHAEANACPACGPQVALQDRAGGRVAEGAAAIAAGAAALQRGSIVAVKGLGGFHLMVDAANEPAVAELRRRKHREEKPFAVMFPSLEVLGRFAELDDASAQLLSSAVAPIVLLRRRAGPSLAPAVAPGNPWIGALLPYTPLHVLLLSAVGRPVVATSGNLAEEPLCTDDAEARQRLGTIADLFLGHNRAIARPVDDSVLRPAADGPVVLRRARGLAPAPLSLPADAAAAAIEAPLLCVGGHLKSAVAVTVGTELVLSPHIGDLENPHSLAAFRSAVALLANLHEARFARVACDAHPDYVSTRFAESLGLPVVRVPHHLAHILACLLEHGGGPDRVLGVAWDGTGYGGDGTVWGGEFILVDRSARRAVRVAHLRPFRLPGGEAAVREPCRSALGVVHAMPAAEPQFVSLAREFGFHPAAAAVLNRMLERGIQAPRTTSAGRLFDAVAALLGLGPVCSFEGQAALQLEAAALEGDSAAAPWPMPIVGGAAGDPLELDWAPAVAALLEARTPARPAELAARFHATLAGGIVAVAKAIGVPAVVLTGGCFQNVRLLTTTATALRAAGFSVLRHRILPPNDGALAAGQALAALWGLTNVESGDAVRSGQ